MFAKLKRTSKYDDEITSVLERMKVYDPVDSEYKDLLTQLERLQELRNKERGVLNSDTAVIAGSNLLSVLIMVAYERGHVMTSKSLGMLLRTKLN